ncbi:ABC transporter substrate-binding protein [Granulicella tundricola]|uniref:ABC transporter substrate-binding protein n=1 Tax=Granulicella tundricola TaxID=940615 RepID=UPI0012FA32AD|nr:ABC transporter substrate-binding protein [Granulicella tundricola]
MPLVLLAGLQPSYGQPPNHAELAWSLKYDPKTLDPAKVDDQASETLRFLTGGVLLRMNRQTQEIQPALAASWSVSPDGRTATFHLRAGLRFSDGSALTSADVVSTLKRVLDPATAAPVAEEFLTPAQVTVEAVDPLTIRIHLPTRIVALGKIFDEIAIEPANHPSASRITAGPYTLAEYKRGESLRLQRNPYYYKRDAAGAQLPYLSTLHLDILANREQDQMRFVRGQYQLIDGLAAENFKLLSQGNAANMHDLGPSLNTEQMWFNQAASAPIPDYEKAWFQSRSFRTAVSLSIHRADMARIAYDGHATPANGFVSPANTMWHNNQLKPIHEDTNAALQMLASEGFHKTAGQLVDRTGHPVKFSILTNTGNRSREKMAQLIQQDLSSLGMTVNVVTLDFPALIERLMHTQSYEAALLGLSNVEPDPSSMMNVWLSSSPNHQWNPSEKKPATDWEAELDQQMKLQAEAPNQKARKLAVDRVQQIVYDQLPFIYLVYPNALYAVSSSLSGVEFSVLQPGVVSNIDQIRWKDSNVTDNARGKH